MFYVHVYVILSKCVSPISVLHKHFTVWFSLTYLFCTQLFQHAHILIREFKNKSGHLSLNLYLAIKVQIK